MSVTNRSQVDYALRYPARICGVDFTEQASLIWNLCGYVRIFAFWIHCFIHAVFLSLQ